MKKINLHRLFYPPAWSIAVKLSVALLTVAIAPMGLASYYNLQQSLDNAKSSEYRKLELLAASNVGRLDQLISALQGVVVQVGTDRSAIAFLAATTPQQQASFRSSLQQKLNNIFYSNSDYDAVYLLDKKGRCVASTDAAFLDRNYNFREYFQEAIRGRDYISGILVGKTTKRPGLYLSSPVRANSGEIVGVAVIKIRAEKIWALVNSLQVGSGGSAFLIDQYGVIIAHRDRAFLYRSLAPLSSETMQYIVADRRYGLDRIESLNLPDLASVAIGAKEPGHASYRSPGDKTIQTIGFAPLQVQPWVLGVTKPREQFVAPLERLIWQSTSRVFIVGAIAAFVALFLARSITKPISLLTGAAEALEREDFKPQTLAVVSHSQDDMGQLVRVFIQMASEIEARQQKLKQQVQELHIEIDETKKARQVAEVTGTEYFQQLQQKAQKIRNRTTNTGTDKEYFDRLQKRAQALKKNVT
jgi:C4-dicarboxylate-specific signal transduction histidine kinase